jgi:Na+/H+-dicarboxylate symporter
MFDFSYKKAWRAILNAMPSYLTGFGTMSSVLTIPISIECAIKNGVTRSIAQIALPIMANIHLLGDSVCTPMLTLVTMYLFLGYIPDFNSYVSFVFYFCTALFAVSGIPGGGILVMIPILISHFSFTPEMISVVTTIYFLMDSFGTAANVMGDGALAKGVNNGVQKILGKNRL